MESSTKNPFKFNLLGLFNLDTEIIKTMSFTQILILIILVMGFLLAVIWLLKLYAIPLFTGTGSIKTVMGLIEKIKKVRSP
jgi:hypothetical protein